MRKKEDILKIGIYFIIAILFIVLVKMLKNTLDKKEQGDVKVYSGYEQNIRDDVKKEKGNTGSNMSDKSQIQKPICVKCIIEDYLTTNDIDTDRIAIYFHDFKNNSIYKLNENVYFEVASLYKLPLAVMFYDMINNREIDPDSSFVYQSYMTEEEDLSSGRYFFGESIKVKDLLHDMIFYSDNSASHILFENMGGWGEFCQRFENYTTIDNQFYDYLYTNYFTAAQLNDFLDYVYKNRERFSLLLKDMKDAEPNSYFNQNEGMEQVYHQKYGSYEGVVSSCGFYLGDNPFSLVIITNDSPDGLKIVSDLAEIIYKKIK